jgi:hypothetical protein
LTRLSQFPQLRIHVSFMNLFKLSISVFELLLLCVVNAQQIVWLSPGETVNGVLTNQTSLATTVFAWNATAGFEHALILYQSKNDLTLLVAPDTIPSPLFFLWASQYEVVIPSCAVGSTFYATFMVDSVTSLPQSYSVTLNITDTVIQAGKVLTGSTTTQRFFTFTITNNNSLPFVAINNTRPDFPTSFYVFRVMSSCSPYATPLFDSGVILPTERRLDFPLYSSGTYYILLDPGFTLITYTITVGVNTVTDIQPTMFNGTETVPAVILGPTSPSVPRYFHVAIPNGAQFTQSLFVNMQGLPGDVYIKFNALPTLDDPTAFYYPSTTVVNIPPCALYPGDWYFGVFTPVPGLEITVAVGYIPVIPLSVGGSYVSTSAGRSRWHILHFDSDTQLTLQTMLFAFLGIANATLGIGINCDTTASQQVSATSTILPVSGPDVSFQLSANSIYWFQVTPGAATAITYRISTATIHSPLFFFVVLSMIITLL